MSGGPDAAMLAPVEQLARFIGTGDDACLAAFAGEGVTILENFAPHLFHGPDAVSRWAAGMRAHAEGLRDHRHRFGAPQDFGRDGDRVFFSLPTHWSGTVRGEAFEEDGGWAFLLVQQHGAWRVLSYGWAVTRLVHGAAP